MVKALDENGQLPRRKVKRRRFVVVSGRPSASAGRYFTWASRMPDHAEYVERFAAFANQKAGNTGMAILLWKHTLLTGNAYMQDVARKELQRLGVQ